MSDNNAFIYLIVFLLTFVATVFVGRLIIPFLKRCAEQPIYEDGPSWHMSKTGTPTMGGLSFLIAVIFVLFLCSLYEYLSDNTENAVSIIIASIYALLNAAVGIVDDITKLRHKKNAGLTPRAKLILQFILSALFLTARKLLLGDSTVLKLASYDIDFGIFYYFISLIILVGITNCANLTDGIDGLASSVAFAIGIAVFYSSYARVETASFIAISLVGASVGFLVFNIHPAKIFMGDTGSLFLGALIVSMAFELKNPISAIAYGGVYVIEGISVILQVIVYKATKKRLFKMAPVHHHLERCGWDENKICLLAIILTFIFSIPAILVLL